MSYEYTAHQTYETKKAETKKGGLLRIERNAGTGTYVTIAEYRLDWSGWTEPVEINLGDDFYVAIAPHTSIQPTPTMRRRYVPGGWVNQRMNWGRVSAFRRRWGATSPVDMMDDRIVNRLRRLEDMERLLWLVDDRPDDVV